MMEDVRSPMLAAQPFEESQGLDSSPLASPEAEALDAFYKDMEIKDMERKTSKRSRLGSAIWSRKSVKRSSTAPPVVANPAQTLPSNHQRTTSELERNGREAGEWLMDNQDPRNNSKPQSPRSVVPDSTNQNQRDPWLSIPLPGSTKQYNLHNPLGPRWYKNHHLIPPGEKKPTARPPTFFSSSFPGITTTSSQERFEDGPPAGPSRTPSNSPLPTPNSSQTRVFDGSGKPRIRKTSQTAHDTVDLMDPTDPWGTHWHHKSPYDIGLANEPISLDLHGAYTRGRRASLTTQSRSQSMRPSPLSQSTSAVNLSTPRDFVAPPRKLSKRRTANGNIFGGGSQSLGHSTGPSPFRTRPASENSVRPPMSGYHPSMTSLDSKKEKRGSVLGRLVRKFSLLKRRSQDEMKPPESIVPDEWHHVGESFAPLRTSPDILHPSPEPSPDSSSPPPPPEQELTNGSEPEPEHEHPPSPRDERPTPVQLHDPGVTPAPVQEKSLLFPDQQSITSVEAHFSIGKLTVANPDTPESEHNTPAQMESPLPEPTQEQSNRDTQYSTMSNLTYMPRNSILEKDILLNLHLEKTLPPPPPMELTPSVAPSISLQHTYTPQTSLSSLTQAQTNLTTTTQATQASSSEASFTTQATGKNTQTPAVDPKPDVTPRPFKRASELITNSPAPSSMKSPESFSTARLPAASPAAPSWVSLNLSSFDTPTPSNRISLDHTATPPAPPPIDKRSSHRPSPIPFPMSDTDSLPNIPSLYDYSPYSASSVLANPPTPAPPRDIPVPKTKEKEYKPSPLAQPQNSHTRKKSTSHTDGLDVPTVSRMETFKLVRSPSGNVETGSAATMAGGDQWQIIGSPPPPERASKDKEREKERPTKLERKRDRSVRESKAMDSKRGSDSPVSPISPTSPFKESREREKKRESRTKGESESREHKHGHDRERSERSHYNHGREHSSREIRDREQELADRERELRERELRIREREREQRERDFLEREYRERQREKELRAKEREREERYASREHKSRDREHHRDSKEASSSSRHESRHAAEPSSSSHRDREYRRGKQDDRTLDRKAAEAAVAAVKSRDSATPESGSEPRSSVVRRTSSSARPTSQLPSAAELNALRAREAWEMERLWKARSINGESSGFSISGYGTPSFAAMDGLIPTSVVHGTNHTTFVVQAPFMPNGNSIYHSMPTAPPPIIYPTAPAPAPPPKQTITTTTITTSANKLTKKEKPAKTSDPERKQRKHHSVSAVPALDANKPLPPALRPPNPLPAPPRDSFHDAKPFPQVKDNSKRSSDYWTPLAGVAISH